MQRKLFLPTLLGFLYCEGVYAEPGFAPGRGVSKKNPQTTSFSSCQQISHHRVSTEHLGAGDIQRQQEPLRRGHLSEPPALEGHNVQGVEGLWNCTARGNILWVKLFPATGSQSEFFPKAGTILDQHLLCFSTIIENPFFWFFE